MKKSARIVWVVLLVAGVAALAGCAGGPLLRAALTFKQGPELHIGFESQPLTVTNLAPVAP